MSDDKLEEIAGAFFPESAERFSRCRAAVGRAYDLGRADWDKERERADDHDSARQSEKERADYAEAKLAEAQEMIAVEHSGCEAALKQMEDATALVEIQRAEVERLRAKLAEAQAARDQAQQASGRLMDEVERLRSLLSECLQDYGHPNFTDRHGMADRIRAALRGPGEKT